MPWQYGGRYREFSFIRDPLSQPITGHEGLASREGRIRNVATLYSLQSDNKWSCVHTGTASYSLDPGNPMLLCGVPVVPIQKSFGLSERDWKPRKKSPIPGKFCTYRFFRYSPTCYGKVRIDLLMAITRNPPFFASPMVKAARFVVFRPL